MNKKERKRKEMWGFMVHVQFELLKYIGYK